MSGSAPVSVVIASLDDVELFERHLPPLFRELDRRGVDDEVVVVLGAALSGRPHHRIGDRYQDLREMAHDVDNPAGV